MAVSQNLEYHQMGTLFLDPLNPRLGRHRRDPNTAQDIVLGYMIEQVLDELALSYIESGGFWSQEALLAVEEPIYGESRLVVVEGNRRLAALKCIKKAIEGAPINGKWERIAESAQEKGAEFLDKLFSRVPLLRVDSRKDVDEFLGFRHVTGIKQWAPAEKAQFINMLLLERGYTYEEVTRKIGSRIPAIKKSYIAYRLLLQVESTLDPDELPSEQLEERFSLLYSSLGNPSVQAFLGISMDLNVEKANVPIEPENINNLKFVVRCLYGDRKDKKPIVSDTRYITEFGKILESREARDYILIAKRPDFQTAYDLAGGSEQDIEEMIYEASLAIRSILGRVHLHKKSDSIRKAVKEFKLDSKALLDHFPDIVAEDY